MTHELLRHAIGLAAKARESGNPPFGSLLAAPDGTVLAEARNTSVTDRDITAHPELKLARWAARELDAATAAKTTMYTSCEPCGMCAGAIERSGLGRVVFALSTAQLGTLKPAAAGAGFTKEGPALFDEAQVPVDGYYR
ncbi:nucleoside deaminase [Amycolatopsis saalfeldensis]|uniref:tRNA(Arg) A34 adenosine deaminase TadA n=1 Tax=Amycolatopsis saalfeldensis TaxID=394193 RepID=A0A1H8YPD5_9PSEU|nr:nucleoside deaminase [Amycolatopsis saalfeldensis]SEP53228.1 tRNA(Arg) A34 adenosine deaminase TadA [Amycolatopsis saalfeldensis]